MTDVTFTAEHHELREVVRRFCADLVPESAVRNLLDSGRGVEEATWRRMAGELGLPGLTVPEEYGGLGFGFLELALVLEELGAALACSPLLSTVLAAEAVLLAGDEEAAKEYLPRIASGELYATVVLDADPDTSPSLRVSRSAGQWLVDGAATPVPDGAEAGLVIVQAQGPEGLMLLAVDAAAPGLERTALRVTDQTRPLAKLVFRDTPAKLLSGTVAGLLDRAAVAVAAEQAGAARRCVEMSVDYARTRRQFGHAIGEFQAIQHKCVDMLLELESSRAAVYHAAGLVAAGDSEAPAAASLAKAYVADAGVSIAAETIQVHGGIGFTWEHPAHLYYRRALGSAVLFGDARLHRELLVRRIGLPVPTAGPSGQA